MCIQSQNNFFNSLPNEVIDNIASFLPKNDAMKLGLTSKRLYAVGKDTLFRNLTQEQNRIKRDIDQLFVEPENGANLNLEQLLATMKLTSKKVDAKMKEYFSNSRILSSLNHENVSLSFSEMFEMNRMMNRFSDHKELEKQLEKLVYPNLQQAHQQLIAMKFRV